VLEIVTNAVEEVDAGDITELTKDQELPEPLYPVSRDRQTDRQTDQELPEQERPSLWNYFPGLPMAP
jgi:hypothetical protein